MQNRSEHVNRENNELVQSILIVMAIISLIGSFIAHANNPEISWAAWIDGALQNFGTEMLGALATFVLIDMFIGEKRAKQGTESKRIEQQLNTISRLYQASSLGARQAIIDEMQEFDLLKNINLSQVNLPDVMLDKAKLENTNLAQADLSNANLAQANLHEAILTDAVLFNANLVRAILTNAQLVNADLENVDLRGANLRGADLTNANLQNVVWGAINPSKTRSSILPDGTQWTWQEDLGRFTDIFHPQYNVTKANIKKVVRRR